MDNKWFKLSLVSFIGILVSMFGLYFVQASGNQAGHLNGSNHAMGGTQTMVDQSNMDHGNAQAPGQHGSNPQALYPGQGYNEYLNFYHLQFQINTMRNQMNQMMLQMNQLLSNMNNLNMSNMNNMGNMNTMGNMNNINMPGGMAGMM